MESPLVLQAKPGVKRDGTRNEGDFYVDCQWMRFNNLGRPQKMGGYTQISQLASGLIYGCHVFCDSSIAYIHTGHANGLEVQYSTFGGVYSAGPFNRTPAAFPASANNIWVFDSIFDSSGGGRPRVLAHAAQNLADIDSNVTSKLYYGDITATGALTDTGAPELSGGVCVLHPYTFVYGSDGRVGWSNAGTPATWPAGNTARITASKIVYGAPIRGGAGQAPAGLFWSLDSLVRATFIGGSATFNFDTITSESSVLSSRGIVEMDGIYYWIGAERFLMFNGVVREIPNALNNDWFFENLNQAQRQKVWATKIPRWGEIWWFYPRGTATECTHAVVYNTRLQTWYDTELPEGGRTDGYYARVARNPIWCGTQANALGKYILWSHESYGSYNKVAGGQASAIQSYFVTPDLNYNTSGKINNMRITRLELDLNQVGDMTASRLGRRYPRSPLTEEGATVFSDTTEVVDGIRGQSRYLYLKFESNTANGFYEMGDTLVWIAPGDIRPAPA